MISAAALKGTAITLLTFVGNAANKLLKSSSADSLVSFTRSTRIEPIALVDKALVNYGFVTDLMQSVTANFTAYYLQAVALQSTAITGVKTLDVLQTLNPNRDVRDATATMIVDSLGSPSLLSLESYRYRLPVPGEALGIEAFGLGLEAPIQDRFGSIPTSIADLEASNQRDAARRANAPARKEGAGTISDNKVLSTVHEAVNLSVGRMFEVTIQQGAQNFKVPVAVRVVSTIVDSSILTHILGGGSRNYSLKERFHMWRAGQLEFIKDIVLMQDLIDAHKSKLLKDSSGAYAEIMNRRRNNGISGMISGNPSIGTASNIVLMAKRTADAVERAEGGRFSDTRFRNRVFKNTYLMFLYIVDEETERVTIYTRDIALPTQLSIRELKSASKGSMDPLEILKAYQLGNPARL